MEKEQTQTVDVKVPSTGQTEQVNNQPTQDDIDFAMRNEHNSLRLRLQAIQLKETKIDQLVKYLSGGAGPGLASSSGLGGIITKDQRDSARKEISDIFDDLLKIKV